MGVPSLEAYRLTVLSYEYKYKYYPVVCFNYRVIKYTMII